MQIDLALYGLDRRFVQLTAFVMIGTWVCLSVLTFGLVWLGWHIVLLHQVVAWPFALLGWGGSFRLAQGQGFGPRRSAMLAGIGALILAEIGTAQVINVWSGSGGALLGLTALPILAPLVILGVLWLYRAETWPTDVGRTERTEA